jgi:serine/threonine-protein kinase
MCPRGDGEGDERIGSILGGYRLTRALDSGGMAHVYAGERVRDGREVAVKVLRKEFHSDTHLVGRFLDEARSAQKLVHKNIVRIFDHGLGENRVAYLAMELLHGVPVVAYTREGARVAPDKAVTILLGMLAGLAVAHDKGIVHRDLKPANVFLARNPEGLFEVKLLDFGVAKVMDAAGGMGSKTKTGMFLGTPAYMSPEQVTKPKEVDRRTDLWACGVVFYRLVTGMPPFPGRSEVDRLTAILNDSPDSVQAVDPALMPYGRFLDRALQKDRAARFQTADEMSAALIDAHKRSGRRA